jgi:hypothetical protein
MEKYTMVIFTRIFTRLVFSIPTLFFLMLPAVPAYAQTNTFPLTGYVGIGTTVPAFALTAIGTEWNSSQISLTTYAGTPTAGGTDNYTPQFRFEKARGTAFSSAKVENGDRIGAFLAAGHDGSKMQRSAAFGFRVDGATSAGQVPVGFFVQTGDASSNKPERFLVKSDGGVVIKDLGSGSTRFVTANDTGLLGVMPILDNDPANEIQSLSMNASSGDLSISGGNSVNVFDDDWQYFSGSGNVGEVFHAGDVALGDFTDPNGHGLNVQNYTSGKAAVRGANHLGVNIYAEGMLGVLDASSLGFPLDAYNIGVLGIKPSPGFGGAGVAGWNNDDSQNNFAGLFVANGVGPGINYGIYASATNGATNYAGYFDGEIRIQLPSGGGFKTAALIQDPGLAQGFGMEFKNPAYQWLMGPQIGNWSDGRFTLLEDAASSGDEAFIFSRDGKLGLMNISQTPGYRLHIVNDNFASYAAYIDGENDNSNITSGYGVFGGGGAIGLFGVANERDIDGTWYNVQGYQFTGAGDNTGYGYGVYGYASGSRTAGYSLYSIYGNQGSTLGSGTAAYAGYFSGNVTVTGTFNNPSDRKLKQDIIDIPSGLAIIRALQPRSFRFKNEAYPQMKLPEGRQFGFVAQELEEVLPELVSINQHPESDPPEGSDELPAPAVEFKGIQLNSLIPILTQGIKELTEIVETQNEKIARMEKILEDAGLMKAGSQPSPTGSLGEKPRHDSYLLQNQPNPFQNQTEIPFYLEGNPASAAITLHDIRTGSELIRIPVSGEGFGKVEVGTGNLASGTYVYCLWVNGEKTDSRTMILAR